MFRFLELACFGTDYVIDDDPKSSNYKREKKYDIIEIRNLEVTNHTIGTRPCLKLNVSPKKSIIIEINMKFKVNRKIFREECVIDLKSTTKEFLNAFFK